MKPRLIVLASAVNAASPRLNAPCDRSLLEEATSRYTAAQSQGQTAWLEGLLAPNATYFENNVARPLNASTVLHQALGIARAHHLYDTTECATYTELIAPGPGPGFVIGTQLRISAPTRKISRIDSIITTAGDLYFNASHTLHYALLEDWSPVAGPDSGRDVVRAAADAYYAVFSDNTTRVPWGVPCRRLEGGAYMAAGLANDTCDAGLPPFSVQMPNRRYVVDESIGAVNILSHFGILGPDSHEFRVEGGRLKYIHAITACDEKPGCNAPPFPGLDDDVGW
ncbi:hypothetical protein F4778DRAFT_101695 [Xylariomycetidae sp. FL2044]|nr:hypothetical protein F4778DRAFT_101695 [Xylariomycetidae sp. FL2044]